MVGDEEEAIEDKGRGEAQKVEVGLDERQGEGSALTTKGGKSGVRDMVAQEVINTREMKGDC